MFLKPELVIFKFVIVLGDILLIGMGRGRIEKLLSPAKKKTQNNNGLGSCWQALASFKKEPSLSFP